MKEILVIIPAYNEAGSIERVVEGCKEKLPDADYLVVNDGSSDDTAKILRVNGYRALYLPVNLGLAGAFRAGMRMRRATAPPSSSTATGSTGRSTSPQCTRKSRRGRRL